MSSMPRKIFSVVIVLVLFALPCAAQQNLLAHPLGPAAAVAASGGGTGASNNLPEAERVKIYRAKLKRRDALKSYLASVDPKSKDFEVTEKALRELEQELSLLSSSGPAQVNTRPQDALPGAGSAVRLSRAGVAPQADDPQTFNLWLNQRIDTATADKIKALINQGSLSNQAETPSVSDSSTALVDQSSAPDIMGVAANLLGLTNGQGNSNEGASVSATATAYSLYSAFLKADPLDPAFYNKNRRWRQASFTLGYEKEKTENGVTIPKATIGGVKVLLLNEQDASQNLNELGTIRAYLKRASKAFGNIDDQIKSIILGSDYVRQTYVTKSDFQPFLTGFIQDLQDNIPRANAAILEARKNGNVALELKLTDGVKKAQADLDAAQKLMGELQRSATLESANALVFANREHWTQAEREFFEGNISNRILIDKTLFAGVLAKLTPEENNAIDKLIQNNIDPFVALDQASRKALEDIRKKPQFSLALQTKNREQLGDDEYKFEAIYEQGLTRRIGFTFNGAFNYLDKKIIGGDQRGGSAAGQLQFQMTPENSLISKGPIFFYVSGDGKWLSGSKPMLNAQAKVKIPITDGIEVPFSLTYSNRTETTNKKDFRGQFSLTIDTSKLLRAFVFKQLTTQ
jgi:hypothetical protein